MKVKLRLLSALSIIFMLSAYSSAASNSIGSTGAQILEVVPDARTSAMGETFCGISDDVNCLHYNPAGLAGVQNIEIPLSNSNWIDMNNQYMGIAYSLHDLRTVNINDMGTLAVTFNDFNSGEIDGRDASGIYQGKFTARDQVVTAAYGKTVYEESNVGKIMAGVAVKSVTEEIKDENASGMALDAGLLWKLPWYNVTAGASLQNFGKKMKYSNEEFDLPTNVKVGASIKMFDDSLLLGIDINDPKSSNLRYNLGAEYYFMKTIALRCGYNTRYSEGRGLSMGMGISMKQLDVMTLYAKDVSIDYAFIPFGELGDMHKISVTLKIGAD